VNIQSRHYFFNKGSHHSRGGNPLLIHFSFFIIVKAEGVSMYYRTAAPGFGSRGSGCSGRLIMAGAIAIFFLISSFWTTQNNPITGETQHISITPEQEIALGLQAAPQMESEFGGEDTNPSDQAIV